jgi:hypothetical protein
MTMTDETPKPPPEEDLPEDGGLSGDRLDGLAEELPDDGFMDPDSARADATVDDGEGEEPVHTDLPDGATAADYDAGEETPPFHRGQRRG